jgi:hypothetical protein
MSRYDNRSETMRVLGESLIQYSMGYERAKIVYDAYMDNLNPHDRVPVWEMMADAYALGVMDGKHSERQRRRGKDAGKEV